MANVWRRQPSNRLPSFAFTRNRATDASTLIAEEFFEAAAPEPPDPPSGLTLRMLMGVGL